VNLLGENRKHTKKKVTTERDPTPQPLPQIKVTMEFKNSKRRRPAALRT